MPSLALQNSNKESWITSFTYFDGNIFLHGYFIDTNYTAIAKTKSERVGLCCNNLNIN